MKTKLMLLILLTGILSACEQDGKNDPKLFSFSGKAQKGPFITGTNVTLNELNTNLGQTGKSFTTTLNSDDGSFELNNIELNSNLVLLTANGFYFNEIFGELSSAPLSLQALSNLSDKQAININILTHLIKERIEYLVSNGQSFQEANEQAKSEMLTFLNVSESFDVDFEDLDISHNNDYNAVLLAFSIILQRYTSSLNEKPTLIAELTQLLTNLSTDFKDDGCIDNQKLIDTLLYNISQLNLIDIRNNIEERYSELGISTTIPNFEKYIAKFQEKYSNQLYTNFYYPDSASPNPLAVPDLKLPNILVQADTIFQLGRPYSIAAIIPLNSSLTIKIIGNKYIIGNPMYGWELINNYPNEIILNSQRQNELMTTECYFDSASTAIIEYYENSSTPTFTKNIKWE